MDLVAASDAVTVVEANLGFYRPAAVVEDGDGRGLKRAINYSQGYDAVGQLEYRRCQIRDWSAPGQPRPSFRTMGFETIDYRTPASPARAHSTGR